MTTENQKSQTNGEARKSHYLPRLVSGPIEYDWPEDSRHDNGNYSCQCLKCRVMFTGHKRRTLCKACATSR